MARYLFSFLLLSGIILLASCETEYIPSTIESQQEIVVEGYIEVGQGSNPTYVILTKSIPFISSIAADKFNELFVKNASVTVFDGDKTVFLPEICLSQVPEEFRAEVYNVLGINPDSVKSDICVYADILAQIKKEHGRKYDLKVVVDGKVLTASTTVPMYVGLDTFRWDDPPGVPRDSLAQLLVTINDPAGVHNYYRYFTATSRTPRLTPPFNSVVDDAIFDGKNFEFPLQRAQRRGIKFNPNTFGLFHRKDSVWVKWCNIDKAHYDFWRTRDFSANSGGPFSSYTRISTNVNGGLGIWGGYAVGNYKLFVPPK